MRDTKQIELTVSDCLAVWLFGCLAALLNIDAPRIAQADEVKIAVPTHRWGWRCLRGGNTVVVT